MFLFVKHLSLANNLKHKFMKLNCSCGNIEVIWNSTAAPLLARKCSCDYCSARDIDYVSDAESIVSYKIQDLSKYRIVQHGTNTAHFHECVNCGLVLVTSEIDNDVYSVLNAKVLGIKDYLLDPQIKVFNEESIPVKLARRKSNWCRTLV
jgi:hypothetical protein